MKTHSTGIEIGDIFRQYSYTYINSIQPPSHIMKAIEDIEQCRTSKLGGIIYQCDNDECRHTVICYKPCGNRHCPKCDFLKKEKWLFSRKQDILPVSYFHIVFTLPHDLNPIALVNQKVVYDILFKSASETLIDLGKDPKHIGGQIGLMAFLHTWDKQLLPHIHLHCIVPGGGLSEDGSKWIYPKKTTEEKDFFIHVDIISDLYKKKFLAYFKEAYQNKELEFKNQAISFQDKYVFQDLLNKLYGKKWVTYCKSPFKGPEKVIEYLGKYAYRIGISNSRIIKLENDRVTFLYRDYRDGYKEKEKTLHVYQFIRRFLLHVLPKGYMKIRYYGILSSRNKRTKFKRCKDILSINDNTKDETQELLNWTDFLFKQTGIDLNKCPKCKKGRMYVKEEIIPLMRAPPLEEILANIVIYREPGTEKKSLQLSLF